MPDHSLTIGGTTVDGLTSRYDFVIGEGVTLNLQFKPSTASPGYRSRFKTVRDLYQYAVKGSTVRVGRQDDGTPWYRERVPAAASVGTFVVDVDPAVGLDAVDLPGFWGIVTGGSDTSPGSAAYRSLDVELFVLADLADFATASDVESALGSSVI